LEVLSKQAVPKRGEEWNIYKSSPVNEFGEYRFHDILIDFHARFCHGYPRLVDDGI
jgi:hypothetical protein